MSSALPPDVIKSLQNGVLNKYFVIAAEAILFYDYFIMLPAEIEHIWLSKWGVGNVLYMLTRYLAFIESPLMILFSFNVGFGRSPNAESLCRDVYKSGAWVNLLGIVVACNILYLRTAAIWGWTKRALICVAIADSIIIPLACYGMVSYLASMKYTPSTAPTLFPCTVTVTKSKIYLDYIETFLIELTVFALTIYRRFTAWPETPSHLLRTLYSDAVLFFGCLCTTSIINLILFTTPSLFQFYQLVVQLQYILHSVTTARIILHLRIAGSIPVSNDMSFHISEGTTNGMAFASQTASNDPGNSPIYARKMDIELQSVGTTEGDKNNCLVVNPYMI
ncbi:hypothetical protein SCHPADRAFT_905878 [Schizopora paradoxa]|uniref:DUF6533 domain-containing protein n=1 Tax=Schizopora paradoxa TaxID=27342 RepID=A0A0H2RJ24_9AGAM|nr:hypothetical protein SCHPADRAFT_905878 [Schizopora paradoxa]